MCTIHLRIKFHFGSNGFFIIANTLKSKTVFPLPVFYSQAKKKLSQKHFTIFEYKQYVITRRWIKCSSQFQKSFICPIKPEICVFYLRRLSGGKIASRRR